MPAPYLISDTDPVFPAFCLFLPKVIILLLPFYYYYCYCCCFVLAISRLRRCFVSLIHQKSKVIKAKHFVSEVLSTFTLTKGSLYTCKHSSVLQFLATSFQADMCMHLFVDHNINNTLQTILGRARH